MVVEHLIPSRVGGFKLELAITGVGQALVFKITFMHYRGEHPLVLDGIYDIVANRVI